MRLHFLPGQNFDCSCCAKCCVPPWHVAVDKTSRKHIIELGLEAGLDTTTSGRCIAAKKDGVCTFLSPDKLCEIHLRGGEHTKPLGCRQFPFLMQQTPDGVFVGISFYCSAAQKNEGRPLQVHEGTVQELLQAQAAPSVSASIWVKGKTFLTWEGYLALEQCLPDRPAIERGMVRLAYCPPGRLGPDEVKLAMQTEPPPAPGNLAWLEQAMMAGLLARLEAPSPDQGGDILQALMEDRPVKFLQLGWTGPLSAIQQRIGPVPWLDEQLERYSQALLFRKFLVARHGVLENLMVLHLVVRVAELYSHLGALARGADSPEMADFHMALDRCELNLVSHGQEAFVMSHSYPGFLMQRLGLGD